MLSVGETQIQVHQGYPGFQNMRIQYPKVKGTTGGSKLDISWNIFSSRYLQILKFCRLRSQETKQKSTVNSKKWRKIFNWPQLNWKLEFKAQQGLEVLINTSRFSTKISKRKSSRTKNRLEIDYLQMYQSDLSLLCLLKKRKFSLAKDENHPEPV